MDTHQLVKTGANPNIPEFGPETASRSTSAFEKESGSGSRLFKES